MNLSVKNVFVVILSLFLGYSVYLYFIPMDRVKPDDVIVKGKKVWLKYNCNSCHQIYGLGGYLGPDLTNLMSRADSNYLKALVLSGTQVMPKFKLNEHELSNLIHFLICVDSTGSSDPRTLKTTIYGAIE